MCLLTRQVNYFLSCNRFSDQEIDDMLHGAPVDSKGMFDYVKFTRIIKHGKDDDWWHLKNISFMYIVVKLACFN